jgi:cytochrome bd-type quinol oxidase subunit 2
MVVLLKNRLIGLFYISLIILIGGVYLQAKDEKSIQTMAIPVSNKVVVLDAGHGLPDERS